MIPAETEAQILRLFHVERWPVGTIARQVRVHHETVERVLRDNGVPASKLGYRKSKVDPFIPFIVETLTRWPTLRASRLHQMVRERGYTGAAARFRAIVARYRPRKPAEAYLRLSTLPGEQAQVDWAHFGHLAVPGGQRPLVAFVMVLSWSRRIFLRFGLDLRTGAFLHRHAEAFAAFGGVPRVLLYDNLKSAVLERQGDAIRFNETLLAFAARYRYEPRPVAPYRGNEKGRVERSIRYIRDNFFAARSFRDLDDLNAQAAAWCEAEAATRHWPEDRARTVADVFAEEQPRLLPMPDDPFPAADRVAVVAGKTPYVRFDSNDYSVPHDRVRRALTLLASPDRVRVLDGAAEVAHHARCWGVKQVVEDPAHIAGLVAHKRHAREGRAMNRLFVAVPEARDLLQRAAERGGNLGAITVGLTRLLDSDGAEALATAIREVLGREVFHVAGVRQALDRARHASGQPAPVPVALPADRRVVDLVVRPHALDRYDTLRTEADHD